MRWHHIVSWSLHKPIGIYISLPIAWSIYLYHLQNLCLVNWWSWLPLIEACVAKSPAWVMGALMAHIHNPRVVCSWPKHYSRVTLVRMVVYSWTSVRLVPRLRSFFWMRVTLRLYRGAVNSHHCNITWDLAEHCWYIRCTINTIHPTYSVRMSPEDTHKLMWFIYGGFKLGGNTMYRHFCFFKLFPIVCIGLKKTWFST